MPQPEAHHPRLQVRCQFLPGTSPYESPEFICIEREVINACMWVHVVPPCMCVACMCGCALHCVHIGCKSPAIHISRSAKEDVPKVVLLALATCTVKSRVGLEEGHGRGEGRAQANIRSYLQTNTTFTGHSYKQAALPV